MSNEHGLLDKQQIESIKKTLNVLQCRQLDDRLILNFANLRYSVCAFLKSLQNFDKNKTVVYFVDASEIYAFATQTDSAFDAYTFGGLLCGSESKNSTSSSNKSNILSTDLLNLLRIIHSDWPASYRCFLRPHQEEIERGYHTYLHRMKEITNWMVKLAGDLKRQNLTARQLGRIVEFINGNGQAKSGV